MSVRDGMLAVLTLGPAYGLQLHSELTSRAPHRKPVNVGQVYGTLDRLTTQSLIEPSGTTDDALPLYRLSAHGQVAAATWMSEPALSLLPDWTEMLDQVVISSSIDPRATAALAGSYLAWWESDLRQSRLTDTDGECTTEARLALSAREALADAAIAWLGSTMTKLSEVDSFRPLSDARPRRGRRANP